MHYLAKKITLFYIKKGKIEEDDREVYEYSFEMLISTIINFLIMIVGALITKRYWETALFTFSFLLFRKFFGGYHAKTHIGCISILVIMYLTMIFMIRFDARLLSIIAMIICSLSIIPVLLLSPVSHPNNPIDKNRIKMYNIVSIFLVLLVVILAYLNYTKVSNTCYSIVFSIPLLFSIVAMIIGYVLYVKNAEGDLID